MADLIIRIELGTATLHARRWSPGSSARLEFPGGEVELLGGATAVLNLTAKTITATQNKAEGSAMTNGALVRRTVKAGQTWNWQTDTLTASKVATENGESEAWAAGYGGRAIKTVPHIEQ